MPELHNPWNISPFDISVEFPRVKYEREKQAGHGKSLTFTRLAYELTMVINLV